MRNMDNVKKIFEMTKEDILCNTSYPYKPEYFRDYKSDYDIMTGVDVLGYYFHIPFCLSLCKFCEYTRFKYNECDEDRYLNLLSNQADCFLDQHKIRKCYGVDIGGGTPLCLSASGLKRLFSIIDYVMDGVEKVKDFERSIEFHYSSLDQEKVILVGETGITRVSTGIQVYDKNMMSRYQRLTEEISRMQEWNNLFKQSGIKKINIDVMYGFEGQTQKSLEHTLSAIYVLNPEQVTLYEMRYNQNGMNRKGIDRDVLFDQYCYLYDNLRNFGYHAWFGQNTFSKDEDDFGVSSYLRYRMLDGMPYRGFGISAQSMSDRGLSYGSFKSCKDIDMPQMEKIIDEDNYRLPAEEVAAKYVSISLYSGSFRLDVLTRILGVNARQYYKNELEFLNENGVAFENGNIVRITKKGFRYYGAIASLFWSEKARDRYLKEALSEN